MRGRVAVLGVAYWYQGKKQKSFLHGLMKSFFTWYAELYLRTSTCTYVM
jgi:hypothetical protein